MSFNQDLKEIAAEKVSRNERRDKQDAERRWRLARRSEAQQRAREAHAEAIAKPFISRELLSDAEREAIYDRVRGRQRWHGGVKDRIAVQE